MEFRCPACNTSYRVPVRIDQQVRCARCNHVWRIAESDFVIDEAMQDESEMPEAFSTPGAEDAFEERRDEPGAQHFAGDNLSHLLDRGEERPGAQHMDESATAAQWSDPAQGGSAGQDDDHDAPERKEAIFANESFASQEPADDAEPAQDPGYDDGGGPSKEDAESFDRRLADSWFSAAANQPSGEDSNDEAEPHAAFERIMEGIEEVIAEGRSSEETSGDHAGTQADDPLRALMSEERTRTLGGTLQDQQSPQEPADDSADPWGGKVVRLTARGGDRQPEVRGQDHARPEEEGDAPSGSGASVEPMADLIDKIASGRAEPSDFAEPVKGGGDERVEAEPAESARNAMSEAHFEALQADMEDAAHTLSEGDSPAGRDRVAKNWADQSGHDEELRESLAFDAAQEEFGARNSDEPRRGEYAGDDGGSGDHDDDFTLSGDSNANWREADRDRWRDEPADIFAADTVRERALDDVPAMDAQDDDALLAEYDFGDEEADETPLDVAEQPRRGAAGTLTVAAAWALFLAVLAAGVVTVISFREPIAKALPAAAPVYDAIGYPVDPPPLVFGEVSYSWDETSPNTLILTGQVKNNRSELTEVPNMQITARDENGEVVAEESQFLGQSALLPGETYDFRVRLEVSPEKLKTVDLRF